VAPGRVHQSANGPVEFSDFCTGKSRRHDQPDHTVNRSSHGPGRLHRLAQKVEVIRPRHVRRNLFPCRASRERKIPASRLRFPTAAVLTSSPADQPSRRPLRAALDGIKIRQVRFLSLGSLGGRSPLRQELHDVARNFSRLPGQGRGSAHRSHHLFPGYADCSSAL